MAGEKKNRLCTIARQALETKPRDERVGHYISSAWCRWSRSMISSTEGRQVVGQSQARCREGADKEGRLGEAYRCPG